MNKKAQVYILAALMFSAIIYSLSTIPNIAEEHEFKGDFKKLANNYDIESSKLINSIILSKGDVKESFTNFTTLFMSYSKSQNPNFGLIYTLNYKKGIRIGNYLKQKIKIDDGTQTTELEGCFDKIPSSIIFKGLLLEIDATEIEDLGLENCFTDLEPTNKIWIGFTEKENGQENVIWYPFQIQENKAQLMIVNLMQEGPQRQISIAGEGYIKTEERKTDQI